MFATMRSRSLSVSYSGSGTAFACIPLAEHLMPILGLKQPAPTCPRHTRMQLHRDAFLLLFRGPSSP